MIERSPFFDFITYLAMAFGAFVVVIPFWITLVAGSQSLQEVSQVPISLLPSSHLFENIGTAWTRADLGPKLINSFIVAVAVTVGKITLAALQMIPRSISEAGAMDGARPFQRLIDLQLPLIAPTAFFLLIMNLISSFTDSFGLIDVMTEGGPIGQTEVMVYRIYFDGFKGLDYSGAAAQSIVLMLLVIGLTFIQFKWVERRVHYN